MKWDVKSANRFKLSKDFAIKVVKLSHWCAKWRYRNALDRDYIEAVWWRAWLIFANVQYQCIFFICVNKTNGIEWIRIKSNQIKGMFNADMSFFFICLFYNLLFEFSKDYALNIRPILFCQKKSSCSAFKQYFQCAFPRILCRLFCYILQALPSVWRMHCFESVVEFASFFENQIAKINIFIYRIFIKIFYGRKVWNVNQ